MEGVLAIVFIFGGGSLFLLAISPVGRAIADRIRSGTTLSGDELDKLRDTQMALLDEVEALRQQLTDVEERLDFAERVLLKHREPDRLPSGSQEG